MTEVKMPQLGETVVEGTITQWFKQVGDEVAEDEPLFEVSTDKVDSEVPSTHVRGASGDRGRRGRHRGGGRGHRHPERGWGCRRGTARSRTSTGGGTSAEARASTARPSQCRAPPAAGTASGGENIVLSPVVRRLITENGLDPSQITGTGKGGRITRSDVEANIAQNRSAVSRPRGPACASGPASNSRTGHDCPAQQHPPNHR